MQAMTWRTSRLNRSICASHVDVNGTGHHVAPLLAGFGLRLRARQRANIERAKE